MSIPQTVRATTQILRKGEVDRTPTVIRAKDPMTIVIFGASGDLSKRKLIPALYNLHQNGCLPDKYAVIGLSRTPMSDEAYRQMSIDFMKKEGYEDLDPNHYLFQALHYCPGNNDTPESFQALRKRLEEVEAKRGLPPNRLYYLSVAPHFFSIVVEQLMAARLIHDPKVENTWSRVIIEKPFGTDLESARALNAAITGVLDESQIYRIDHYLGKETVQNIISFRFGNTIFEPTFNNKYVDNVQITVSETLGMEGKRGAYYDTAGAMRDMVQNHMFQVLCLTAMEPPAALDSTSIRDEKVKVLRALEPYNADQVRHNTVRAQYGPKLKNGQTVEPGYLGAEGVDPESTTESFVAMRLFVNNWRWAGVPFFLRHGKRLAKRVTEVAIQFKQPPMHLFKQNDSAELCLLDDRPIQNQLVLRIQPDDGISLSFGCKPPGMQMRLQQVDMDFLYKEAFDLRSPEAYERLILDALRGDASLFTRSDEVEYAWRFIGAILDGWKHSGDKKLPQYEPYGEGPLEARKLMEGSHRRWRLIKDM